MKRKLLLAAIIISVSLRLSATNYYVSNAGSDTNLGTSTSQAWASVNKVNSSTLSPGDIVSFEDGGIWREQLSPQSGSSGSVITYNSYGSGNKPLFLGSVNANSSSLWSNLGSNIWSVGGVSNVGSNLVTNSSFTTNTTGWTFYCNTAHGASATFARDTTTYNSSPASGQVAVTTTGTTETDLQLYTTNLSITSGHTYRLTFAVKASAAFTMRLPSILKQSSPFSTYGTASSAWTGGVTSTWSTVNVDFAASVTATDVRLNFFIGNTASGTTVNIDDATFTEISTIFPNEVGNLNFNNPSYVTNCSFTTDTSGWSLLVNGASGASATFGRDTTTYSSAPASGGITVSNPGLVSSDIELICGNLSVSNGKVYRLTLNIQGSSGFTMPQPCLTQQVSPYTSYTSSTSTWTGTVTTSWSTLSIDFTSNIDANDAQLVLALGNSVPSGVVVNIDDIHLVELYSSAAVDTSLQNSNIGVRKNLQADLAVQGDFWYDTDNHRVLLYSSADPTAIYDNIECALGIYQLNVDTKTYILVDGLAFWNGAFDCVNIRSSSYVTIQNCDIRFIGGGYSDPSTYTRFGNAFQLWDSVHDITITNNYALNIYDSGISNQGLDVNSEYNLYYNYNTLLACQYSFELWDRPSGSTMHDIYFENNICRNAGSSFSYAQRVDPERAAHILLTLTTATTSNVSITNNICDTSTRQLIWRYNGTINNIGSWVMDYNTYFQATGDVALWSGTTYGVADWAAYQAASAKDANSTLN